ncbi:MAG TPA: Uma2 family endonuclease [Thermoanaerobaculia bacterium]|nr:Uma2 family endonuclease [Thermoanaerobaculia bacterium]
MSIATVKTHRWTREQYERLAEAGLLRPEQRVELVDGVIYDMTPQSSLHATAVSLAENALQKLFPEGFDIRVQMPLVLAADSEPEPDLAVVPGTPRDYRDAHPSYAVLIVEVAGASLAHDRRRKAPLYARAGIPELWILDFTSSVLTVYREPHEGSYRSVVVLGREASVRPQGAGAGAPVLVADLLP